MTESLRIAVRKFDPFEQAIQTEWERFRQQSGSSLELDAVSLDLHPLHEEVLEKRGLATGEFDLALLNTDWLSEAWHSGALADLSPWLEKSPPEGYPDAWAPSLLRHQHFHNAVVGLPYHDGPECLMYRRDLFENESERQRFRETMGRALEVPSTWSELADVARFFHRPEQGLYGTAFAAYPDGHNTVYDFCLQLWTRGGTLVGSDGRVLVDSPQARAGVDFYRQFVSDETAQHPHCRELDSVKAGLEMVAGKLAVAVNWFGFAALAHTDGAPQVRGNIGIAPVPRGKEGEPASLNVYWVMAMGSGSRHQDAAYGFMRHCASALADKNLTLGGGIGCRRSTWHDPEVNAAIPFYSEMGRLHAVARELPRFPKWAKIATVIDKLVTDALLTQTPTEELISRAQRDIDALE